MDTKDQTPETEKPAEEPVSETEPEIAPKIAPETEPEAAPENGDGVEAAAEAGTAGESEAPAAPAKDAAATAEEEIAGLKDKLLRALAENENLARRARKEREDTAKFAASNLARDVLPVADNLRRALESVPDELRHDDNAAQSLVQGVELTERALLAALERHGIKKLDPMGEKFNHDLHEAMFEVPTADAGPGTVVQVVEIGYTINDRLLRAARVGIAKALPEEGGEHVVDTTA
jgi:molecular chaperone GrpE